MWLPLLHTAGRRVEDMDSRFRGNDGVRDGQPQGLPLRMIGV